MTRSTAADRAAIEKLARELTDEQWDAVFHEHMPRAPTLGSLMPGRWLPHGYTEALLAYLDEQVEAMRNDYIVLGRGWIVGEGASPPLGELSPLGRAVLRRAKEQGHAGA